MYHSMKVTAWCAGEERTSLPTSIPGSHLHTVIHTRWRINTICLSWWWALCARNMQRVEKINIFKKCVKLLINRNFRRSFSRLHRIKRIPFLNSYLLFTTIISSVLKPVSNPYGWNNTDQSMNCVYITTWKSLGSGCWGIALQAGRSRVRLPTVSLEFFIDIILPTALCSWGRLSL
jgi:hypothetical protein